MCKLLKPLACCERLEVLAFLNEQDRSIQQLSQTHNMCESSASHHLRTLYNSGLIKRVKRGQQVFYRIEKFMCPLTEELDKITTCIVMRQLGSN